ncbi:hypothetical protein EBZ39_04490 [bacterium]|nr:hypothetical protein [bacterium]
MRIVEYRGVPVKRQKRIFDHDGVDLGIRITFYDGRAPIVVSTDDWQKNSKNRYFGPEAKRCEVVRSFAVAR